MNNNKHAEILARGHLNLEANQQGKMSTQQKDWLRQDMKKERQRQYQMAFMSCVVFLVVAIIVILMPFLPIPIIAVPIIWGIGFALWYGYIWVQEKPIQDDLKAGGVQAVTGYIDKSTEQGYHVILGGVKYATHPDMYPAFDETLLYTIYVTSQSKIVLSAEIATSIDDPMY